MHAHNHALTNTANHTENAKIDVAADVLRGMLLELQNLAASNTRLHFAMSSSGLAIRERLDMLSGITELLKVAQAPVHARELSRRAKALIFQLAGELEQLAVEAEQEFE